MAGMAAPENRPEDDASRYVLITQCLQNDFLLNAECRLALPEAMVRAMLLGRRRFELKTGEGLRRLPAEAVAAGPLGLFLEQTIGHRRRGEDGLGVLDVDLPAVCANDPDRRLGRVGRLGVAEQDVPSRRRRVRPRRRRPRPAGGSARPRARGGCGEARPSTESAARSRSASGAHRARGAHGRARAPSARRCRVGTRWSRTRRRR
jgi:hypothetical protein